MLAGTHARRWRLPGAFAVSAACLALCAACGPSGDSPALDNLRCRDEAACQSREDPFTLNLLVDFIDPDGDLGSGTYSVFVDGRLTEGPMPLLDHFAEVGLSPYATEGTLHLPAGVQLSGMHTGMTFVVGIEVADQAGNTSNRPGIKFELFLD